MFVQGFGHLGQSVRQFVLHDADPDQTDTVAVRHVMGVAFDDDAVPAARAHAARQIVQRFVTAEFGGDEAHPLASQYRTAFVFGQCLLNRVQIRQGQFGFCKRFPAGIARRAQLHLG